MANTTLAGGATAPPKSLLARALGVVTAPRETFKDVAAHPRWLGMLVLTTLTVAVVSAAPLFSDAGKEAALELQASRMEAFGSKVDDAQYEQMRQSPMTPLMPYTTALFIIVVGPIFVLIITAILFAVFSAALGGEASFKQLFAVVVHAGVISVLGVLFTAPLNYLRGSMTSATNLGVLLPMIEETSFVGRLLGMIELFWIWYLIVLSIGLAVLFRRRTGPIATTLMVIYGVVAIAIAAIMSRAGGA